MQNILWNVYNYFVTYANAAGWEAKTNQSKSENVLDQWLSARLQGLTNKVTEDLDKYDAFHASRELESFVNDLSTWYLRRSRGRNDESFFATLHQTLVQLTKLLAPFMPFMSEEIYRNLTGEESVHLADWPERKELTKEQSELLTQMTEVRKIVEEVHALRAKVGVKLRQPLTRLVIPDLGLRNPEKTGSRLVGRDDRLLEILRDEVNVKEIVFSSVIPDLIRNPDWILNQVQDDKWVALNINLSDELKLEGLTAELTRQIQVYRKEQGLKIGELVDLYYETPVVEPGGSLRGKLNSATMIERALQLVDKKKTYLREIKRGKGNKTEGKEMEVEGEKIKFLIKRS
jgi:isoleucyl-tRNA synthetase